MKTQHNIQGIYKRFKQFIILGTVAILTVTTATAGNFFNDTKQQAEQGNANAQYNLGLMYYYGQGVTQDHKKAVEYWEKSAELGHVETYVILGYIYYLGDGVTRDEKKGIEYFTKGAEMGDLDSMAVLGQILILHQKYKKAVGWLEKASKQKHPEACRLLAELYQTGKGVKQDTAKALYYSKLGNTDETHTLGNMATSQQFPTLGNMGTPQPFPTMGINGKGTKSQDLKTTTAIMGADWIN